MKRAVTLLLIHLCIGTVWGQNSILKRDVRQIVQARSIYLNGGLNASYGGGSSRTYLKIDLPQNTIEWYYSFSTSKQKLGTKKLDLAKQLSSLIKDTVGTTSDVLSKIYVPPGSSATNIYLCDAKNIKLFQEKVDNNGGSFQYKSEGTVQNTLQGVVRIDDVTTNSWYLGIKNPDQWRGNNITIEVVAVTQTSNLVPVLIDLILTRKKEPEPQKTSDQRKAESYGTLAWGYYERNDLSKAMEYCEKSLKTFELGWVKANMAFLQLSSGESTLAIETYIEAIELVKSQWRSNYIFSEMIKDLKRLRKKRPEILEIGEIIRMIRAQRS